MFVKDATSGLEGLFVSPEFSKIAFIEITGAASFGKAGVSDDINSAPTVLNDGNWHHVAIVRSGSTTSMYVDGASVGSTEACSGFDFSSTTDALIGFVPSSLTGGSPWYVDGSITGLRVNTTAVYTGNFSVPTTLPASISGTQLLLNFEATTAPTV